MPYLNHWKAHVFSKIGYMLKLQKAVDDDRRRTYPATKPAGGTNDYSIF